MSEILENLAMIHLLRFGKENGIDVSGTHLAKNGRGFKWSLVKDDTGRGVLTVIFHKHAVPTYAIHSEYRNAKNN